MGLEDLYYIFNIFAPIVTAVGIFVSFYISIKTLNEIKKDRVLAQKPYLIFKQGGMRDKVVFVQVGKTSSVYKTKIMQLIKSDVSDDAISVRREFLIDGDIRLFGEVKIMGMVQL